MGSSPMLDRLTSDDNREKAKRDERRARYQQSAISIILGLLILAYAIGFIRSWLYPTVTITKVTISGTHALSPTSACPGDLLTVGFDFSGDGAATLIVDATTTDATTGQTLIYSTPKKLIYDGKGSKPVIDQWLIPDLGPGTYRRLLAVSSNARSTAIDQSAVDFSVRGDCKS